VAFQVRQEPAASGRPEYGRRTQQRPAGCPGCVICNPLMRCKCPACAENRNQLQDELEPLAELIVDFANVFHLPHRSRTAAELQDTRAWLGKADLGLLLGHRR